jgi:protein involved in polysaccharide export with SLBB domain
MVDRNGAIYIPKVGNLNVSGLRYDQLHDFLSTAVGRVFRNFELNVTLGQLRSVQVFVVGQVKRPGAYTISSLSTLVNALFASGGPANRGSMRRIELKRRGQVVTTFDMYDLLVRGDKSKDALLLSGDVIYVPPAGPLVAVAGSVNTPAIFELQDRDTLGAVIDYAGGFTTTAAGDRAFLERIDQRKVRRADEVVLTPESLKRELHDGDLIRFLPISVKFENAVTLRGNVAVPGRYPWRQGMRVHDLIPTRDALITEEYWKRQNRLAISPTRQTFEPLSDVNPRQTQDSRQNQDSRQYPDSRPNQDTRQDQRQNQNQNNDQRQNPDARQPQDRQFETDQSVTEMQHVRPEELKNEVKLSAAEINWEYAVVQRLDRENLTTSLLPFNLGRAISGDDTQNLALQPGDIVTIFSQADLKVPIGQQTRFVHLEGEFRAAGVYRAEPGETLRHLVTRSGGFTSQAYLYGAEFTRDSTREDQQKRLDEYVNELEKSVERNGGGLQGRTGDEAVAARESLDAQRRLLIKLRLLRASGRIVLELKPGANSLDQLPDLVLEDGDRLLVPYKPATVAVIGSVHNANAFVFKPGKTAGDYLRIAGGATADGDRGRAFVIRADGSSLTASDHRGLIVNSFNSLRIEAGDTVVVPEKLNKGATLRGFKDWTQIVGQFIIGAAAAKILFP